MSYNKLTFDIFIEKVSFTFLCIYMEKILKIPFFENYCRWWIIFGTDILSTKNLEIYQCQGYWKMFRLCLKVTWIRIFKRLLLCISFGQLHSYFITSGLASWGVLKESVKELKLFKWFRSARKMMPCQSRVKNHLKSFLLNKKEKEMEPWNLVYILLTQGLPNLFKWWS